VSEATPVHRRSYPTGVALYGVLLAASLPIAVMSILATWMSVQRDYRIACIVGAAVLIPGSAGLVLMAGGGLRHQLRPLPRQPVGDSLRWRASPIMRSGVVLAASGLTVSVAVFEFVRRVSFGPGVWIGLALLWLVELKLLTARLDADATGVRCTNPLRIVRIRWDELERLEARGDSTFGQRIVAVTADGRERMLCVFDPRVPLAPGSARMLVDELETVRRRASHAGSHDSGSS
jgi:hypothetical protein